MKNKLIIIILAATAVLALTLYNIYTDDVAAQLEIDREAAIAKGEDYIVAKGRNIAVYNSDVQQIIHQYDYWKTGGSYVDAVNAVAEKAVVAYYAEKAGVTVTDAEVQEYVELQKTASENAVNYSDFEAFVKAGGMTADEYWDAQYNILRMEMLAGKFDEYSSKTAAEKAEYAAEKLKAEKLAVLEQQDEK